jgi:hypothetical protein
MSSGSIDELSDISVAAKARQRFEPTALAQDLAASVELLSVAIGAIPADQLDQSDAERLVASMDTSFDAPRRIRRHIRRMVTR